MVDSITKQPTTLEESSDTQEAIIIQSQKAVAKDKQFKVELKNLTANEFDTCRVTARKRVEKNLGDKPTLKQFHREFANLLNPLDYVMAVLFIAVFVFSAIHVFDFARIQAFKSFNHSLYENAPIGFEISAFWHGAVTQVSILLMAELAMISYFTRWGYYRKKTESLSGGLTGIISLLLGLCSLVIVIMANIYSGVNLFIAVVTPSILVGLGFRLEELLNEYLIRREVVTQKYEDALRQWELASEDIEKHPDYKRELAKEIWQKIYKKNSSILSDEREIDNEFKLNAVSNEIARDNWVYQITLDTQNQRMLTGNFTKGVQPI